MQDDKGERMSVDIGACVMFGVPDWVADMFGIERGLIQSADIRCKNNEFAIADITLIPEASQELQDRLNGKTFTITEIE